MPAWQPSRFKILFFFFGLLLAKHNHETLERVQLMDTTLLIKYHV